MNNLEALQHHALAAKAIVDKAEEESRHLTKAERRSVDDHVEQAKVFKAAKEADDEKARQKKADDDELRRQMDRLNIGPTKGFAAAVLDAGFSLKHQPSVEVPASAVFNSTFSTPDTWRVGEPTIAGLGQDKRFLYSNLPTERVDGESAVQDFKQTVRTLTGNALRELDASTDKASLDVTLVSVIEKLKQVAVTINDVPNAILESIEALRAYLNSEGSFQVQKALDAHVMAQIVAAAPPFGMTGTGLVAKIRNGVATMRATGFSPSLVVVNPTDSASLDLEADAGGYIFPTRDTGTASPLWGLKVVERIGAGTEPPYLIDPAGGQLYLGNVRFEADPFTGFRKNLTTLRIEVNALYHVRQAEGFRRIAAT